MPIDYCCIIARKEYTLMAQSTTSSSSWNRIKPLLKKISENKTTAGKIEIENDLILSWAKSRHIIFMCRSPVGNGQEERTERFLESLINLIKAEFGNLENIIDKNKGVTLLCLQSRLETKLDNLIQDYKPQDQLQRSKTDLNMISNDINELKNQMNINIKTILKDNNNLDELLIKSQKIDTKAIEMVKEVEKIEIETQCIKPWMIYSVIAFFVSGIIYIIFALVRCGNLNIICVNER